MCFSIIVVYVSSNTEATFEAHLMKKLSNSKAKLKKSVAYKKKRVYILCCIFNVKVSKFK